MAYLNRSKWFSALVPMNEANRMKQPLSTHLVSTSFKGCCKECQGPQQLFSEKWKNCLGYEFAWNFSICQLSHHVWSTTWRASEKAVKGAWNLKDKGLQLLLDKYQFYQTTVMWKISLKIERQDDPEKNWSCNHMTHTSWLGKPCCSQLILPEMYRRMVMNNYMMT